MNETNEEKVKKIIDNLKEEKGEVFIDDVIQKGFAENLTEETTKEICCKIIREKEAKEYISKCVNHQIKNKLGDETERIEDIRNDFCIAKDEIVDSIKSVNERLNTQDENITNLKEDCKSIAKTETTTIIKDYEETKKDNKKLLKIEKKDKKENKDLKFEIEDLKQLGAKGVEGYGKNLLIQLSKKSIIDKWADKKIEQQKGFLSKIPKEFTEEVSEKYELKKKEMFEKFLSMSIEERKKLIPKEELPGYDEEEQKEDNLNDEWDDPEDGEDEEEPEE